MSIVGTVKDVFQKERRLLGEHSALMVSPWTGRGKGRQGVGMLIETAGLTGARGGRSTFTAPDQACGALQQRGKNSQHIFGLALK